MTQIPSETSKSPDSIEIPFEEVQKISQTLLSQLKRGKVGFLKEPQTVIQQTGVYDGEGRLWRVSVRLNVLFPGATNGRHREYKGEEFFKEVEVDLNDIEIGLALDLVRKVTRNGKTELEMRPGPDNLTANEILQMDAARLAIIQSILVHEFTHVRDPEVGIGEYFEPGSFNSASLDDRKRYLNQPVEVRAVMNQVINDVKHLIDAGLTVEQMVDRSPVWKTMVEPYMSVENQQRILRALQGWLAAQ